MFLDSTSMWFTGTIIFAGIFYGQYMYRQGLEAGANQAIDGLESAGIIHINEDGEISSKK